MYGIAGINPNRKKETKVAIPLLFAKEISDSTNPLSYSSKFLANTFLFVEKRSTTLLASSLLYCGK